MTTPKPGPVKPMHIVRGAGVNRDDIEARSRIIAMLLPHERGVIDSVEDMLTLAEWVLLGPDDEEDET